MYEENGGPPIEIKKKQYISFMSLCVTLWVCSFITNSWVYNLIPKKNQKFTESFLEENYHVSLSGLLIVT